VIDQHCGTNLPENESASQIQIPEEVYMPERPVQCSLTAALPTHLPNGDWRIYPGYYTDFPQAGLIGQNQNIELAPGIYCVDGDIHWSGATFTKLDGKPLLASWMGGQSVADGAAVLARAVRGFCRP
jgi:hypothetical protein